MRPSYIDEAIMPAMLAVVAVCPASTGPPQPLAMRTVTVPPGIFAAADTAGAPVVGAQAPTMIPARRQTTAALLALTP